MNNWRHIALADVLNGGIVNTYWDQQPIGDKKSRITIPVLDVLNFMMMQAEEQPPHSIKFDGKFVKHQTLIDLLPFHKRTIEDAVVTLATKNIIRVIKNSGYEIHDEFVKLMKSRPECPEPDFNQGQPEKKHRPVKIPQPTVTKIDEEFEKWWDTVEWRGIEKKATQEAYVSAVNALWQRGDQDPFKTLTDEGTQHTQNHSRYTLTPAEWLTAIAGKTLPSAPVPDAALAK